MEFWVIWLLGIVVTGGLFLWMLVYDDLFSECSQTVCFNWKKKSIWHLIAGEMLEIVFLWPVELVYYLFLRTAKGKQFMRYYLNLYRLRHP